MLSLNIKSSSYMCLDIDQDSVIHKHLAKKVTDLTVGVGHSFNTIISNEFPEDMHDHYSSKHNLTMLPSFHISLGKPPQTKDEKEAFKYYSSKEPWHISIVPIIGDITIAPICISEKDGKKSAWIPVNPLWFKEIYLQEWHTIAYADYRLNLDNFDSFDHRCDEYPVQHLHVSVANLTGNPHDSIARPEDCIIDTITA